MNKEFEKMYSNLEEYMKEKNPKGEKEIEKCLQEFIEKHNNKTLDIEETPFAKAMAKLEEATYADDEKTAKKLAKEALKIDPTCMDAKLFLLEFEPTMQDILIKLEKIIKEEKERLTKEGYFTKENIGNFYTMWETRPYMRALVQKANLLIELGFFQRAKQQCEEIIELNQNDNMGIRYTLLGLYTYFEDEKSANKLIKKYKENSLLFNTALTALYYKIGDEKKALEYLKKCHKSNKNFITILTTRPKEKDIEQSMSQPYYKPGDKSEVIDTILTLRFVLALLPEFTQWIKNNKKDI